MKRFLPFIIVGVVLALVAAVLLAGRGASPSSNPNPNLATAPLWSAPGAQPPHSAGSQSAPVVLEEYGDFQCPTCRRFQPTLRELKTDYGNRVRFVFRQLPLTDLHPNAMQAARAAEAAAVQNRFWEMHDLLYEKQDEWKNSADARAQFVEYARALGLDAEKFARDMDDQAASERITLDMQRANSLGINGTPTVLINEREIPFEQMEASGLRAHIERALREKGL